MTGLRKRRDVWTRKHELSAKRSGGAGPVCARGAKDEDEDEGDEERGRGKKRGEGGGELQGKQAEMRDRRRGGESDDAAAACRSDENDKD